MKRLKNIVLMVLLIWLSIGNVFAIPSRIKDVTRVVGLSEIQVVGYGLVIGLDGSGDRNLRTAQIASRSVANMLERFGLTLSPDQLRLRNVAAVMVTASIPPFIESGSSVDVTVSSLGDATSLQGGTLLLTPLMAPNGDVYAQAQGAVTVGGFSAESGLGDRIKQNHTQVGLVINGATMAKSRHVQLVQDNALSLALNDPDFSTAFNLSQRINQQFNQTIAKPVNQATIQVNVPNDNQGQQMNSVSFIAALETLRVDVDVPARVVINERTGTIVTGTHVQLSSATISQGNLTVEIQQRPLISQPAPFSPQGQTVVVPNAQLNVNENNDENKDAVSVLKESATVGEVASALNALGVKPRDLIAIFQALKAAGSLQAELVIM